MLDAGEEVAQWFSEHLGQSCRLVYQGGDGRRGVDRQFSPAGTQVSLADGFPLLLISQASLDDLNRRLDRPVGMDRFRPNLVVSGCEPHAEDQWRQIRIGEMCFDLVKPCARCVIPSIDQDTAQRDSPINRVLASYRRRDGQIFFGQNLLHQQQGALELGMPVEVLA